MDKIITAIVLLSTALVGAALGRTFEYSSGGAYHFEGYGEWLVIVDDDGDMTITHNTYDDEIVDYGPYDLTAAEVAGLWEAVDAIDLEDIYFEPRPGVPDEVSCRFEVKGEGEDVVLATWINDIREHKGLADIINYCGALIQKYTGVKPVLW
jgi:hypothetical protein